MAAHAILRGAVRQACCVADGRFSSTHPTPATEVFGSEQVVRFAPVTLGMWNNAMSEVTNDVRYPAVGRCIYCLAGDSLTEEHIVPLGLSGTAVLPKSSCKGCAAATSLAELHVLREASMRQVRVHRELKSRSKLKGAPRSAVLHVPGEGGHGRAIELPLGEFPVLLFMPHFAAPARVEPAGYERGIRLVGMELISFGPRPDVVMNALGVTAATWEPASSYPVSFARMVAKIGYAYAVARGAWPLGFGLPGVVPSILGVEDQVGRWVGATPRGQSAESGLLHRIEIGPHPTPDRMLVEVQLFADSGTQSYGVLLEPPQPALKS